MVISSKEEVEDLLSQMRKAIDNGNAGLIKRRKNTNTLTHFGILEKDAYDITYGLKYKHYCHGPDPDRDCPLNEPFWFFKCSYQNEVLYIKFFIRYVEEDNPRLVLFSFHLDE